MMTRDELIADAEPLVRQAASKYTIPAGVDFEDIVSAGMLAVVQAAGGYEEARGVPWRAFATQQAKWAMSTELKKESRRSDAHTIQRAAGGGLHVPRADDPAAVAEAREMVLTGRVGRVADSLPPPDEVAERVKRLREVMYAGIRADDVTAMVAAMVEKAKGGHVGAAKLIVDMLAPSRAGVTTVIQQQAIVISPSDVG